MAYKTATPTTEKGKESYWWADPDEVLDIHKLGQEPVETMLSLTDMESMEIFLARVLVSTDSARLQDSDTLSIYPFEAEVHRPDQPAAVCFVQILERFDDPDVVVNLRRDKQRFAQKRGEVLRGLLNDKD
jgi:hypothetical protein